MYVKAVSGFFDPKAAMRAIKGVPPRIQFDGRTGTWSYVVGERDPSTGRYIAKHTPLPFGFKMIVDFGTAERGWLSFNPFDDSHVVPMHQPVDPNPPGEGYTLVVRCMVEADRVGRAQMTLPGVIAQNAAFSQFVIYQRSAEACAGKIPVWRVDPSEQTPIRSRNGELHPVPQFVTIGWVVRDADRWGARTVPLPVAQVETDDATASAPLAPPTPPMATPVAPDPVQPLPPANDAVPTPAATPANDDDAFASMTPAEGAPLF
jgi:hypothetical protein